jgi:translin
VSWSSELEPLKEHIKQMHLAREAGLSRCRGVIQLCAKSIRHMHRRQFEEAEKLLAEAKQAAESARETLRPFGEIMYAGYLHDCEKELVEAYITQAIILQKPYPTYTELGVGVMAYLNGCGEAASECRRYAVDEMRYGRLEEAERILLAMEEIYGELITFDYSDAMTGGLRRTCDALRPVIERTRNDLHAATQQSELIAELRATRERLNPGS